MTWHDFKDFTAKQMQEYLARKGLSATLDNIDIRDDEGKVVAYLTVSYGPYFIKTLQTILSKLKAIEDENTFIDVQVQDLMKGLWKVVFTYR